jgi:hypothetical protein
MRRAGRGVGCVMHVLRVNVYECVRICVNCSCSFSFFVYVVHFSLFSYRASFVLSLEDSFALSFCVF